MRNKKLTGMMLLLAVLALGIVAFQVNRVIFTGFFVHEQNITAVLPEGLLLTEGDTFTLDFDGEPNSISISGAKIGDGTAKLYVLDGETRILIYEAGTPQESPPETEPLPGEISIRLVYNPETPWDPDDDGIELEDGIVDFSPALTEFAVNEEGLCTRWRIMNDRGDESFLCNGAVQCCQFIGFEPLAEPWDEPYNCYQGRHGATAQNEVSAQVVYVGALGEVMNSSWQALPATFVPRSLHTFEEACNASCHLNLSTSTPTFIVELRNARLNITEIRYTYSSLSESWEEVLAKLRLRFAESNVTFDNLTIEDSGVFVYFTAGDAAGRINYTNDSAFTDIDSYWQDGPLWGSWEAATPVLALAGADAAAVTLPATGYVDAILGCPAFDVTERSCAAWEPASSRFSQTGGGIVFSATGYQAYAGRYSASRLVVTSDADSRIVYAGETVLMRANFSNSSNGLHLEGASCMIASAGSEQDMTPEGDLFTASVGLPEAGEIVLTVTCAAGSVSSERRFIVPVHEVEEEEQEPEVSYGPNYEKRTDGKVTSMVFYSKDVNLPTADGEWRPFEEVVDVTYENDSIMIEWYNRSVRIIPTITILEDVPPGKARQLLKSEDSTIGEFRKDNPEVRVRPEIVADGGYEYALTISSIPDEVRDRVKSVSLELMPGDNVDAGSLKVAGSRVELPDGLVLNYNDLVLTGHEIEMRNATSVEIFNVSGEGDIVLDPLVEILSGSEDGEILFNGVRTVRNDSVVGSVWYNTSNDDGGTDWYSKLYLSFNTMSILDNQEVGSATLRLYKETYENPGPACALALPEMRINFQQDRINGTLTSFDENFTGSYGAWNPSTLKAGEYLFFNITPNVTMDTISLDGNSDFELNASSCGAGKSINWSIALTDAAGTAYDPLLNITSSPILPQVTLATPANWTGDSDGILNFTCNASTTMILENVSILLNTSGSLTVNQTYAPRNVQALAVFGNASFYAPFDYSNVTSDGEMAILFSDANFSVGMRRGGMEIGYGTPTGSVQYNTSNNLNMGNGTNGTIMFWYKPKYAASTFPMISQAGYLGLWDMTNASNNYFNILIYNNITGEDEGQSFYAEWRKGIKSFSFGTTTVNLTGDWIHVALSWNSSNTTFFLDGRQNTSRNGSPAASNVGRWPNMTLGRYSVDATMAGIMDEFLIFNESLTEDEVFAVYNTTKPLTAMNATFNLSLQNGTIAWTCQAIDNYNESSNAANYALFVDNVNPSITFGAETEANNTYIAGRDWIYVNVAVTESSPFNTTFSLFNNTALVRNQTYTNETLFHNFTGLHGNTRYYYNVTITDYLGNTNQTETRTIILDDQCVYSTWEDHWIVNQSCWLMNGTVILNGNLTVGEQGNLRLDNFNITVNVTEEFTKAIRVLGGGIFNMSDYVGNRSVIGSLNGINHYQFIAYANSTLIIHDTDLSFIGNKSANPLEDSLYANGSLWLNNTDFSFVNSLRINGNGSNVTNCIFDGGGAGEVAINVTGSQSNISYNVLFSYYDDTRYGMRGIVIGGHFVTLQGNSMNDFQATHPTDGHLYAIWANDVNNLRLLDNSFSDFALGSWEITSIDLNRVNNSIINATEFSNIGSMGSDSATLISAQGCNNLTVFDVDAPSAGSLYTGFAIYDSATVNISDIYLYDLQTGIRLHGRNMTLSEVTVEKTLYSGLLLVNLNDSQIADSTFVTIAADAGIALENSSRNAFSRVHFTSVKCAFDFANSFNNTVTDSILTTSASNDVCVNEDSRNFGNAAGNNTFINVTAGKFNWTSAYNATGFLVKWPVQVLVNETNGSGVDGATVNATSGTGHETLNYVTNASGHTSWLNMTQYFINGTGNYTELPYNLTAWKTRYVRESQLFNFTNATSTYLTLTPYPVVNLSWPPNATYQNTSLTIVCNATDDINVTSIDLWGNFSGSWAKNASNSTGVTQTFMSANFTILVPEGDYVWNCNGSNDQPADSWAPKNFSLFIRNMPSAPTNLGLNVSGFGVFINWTNGTNATNYSISWASSSTGSFSVVGTSNGSNFTDTLDATTKFYRVTAVNQVGQADGTPLLVAHVYQLVRKSGGRTKNWIAIPFDGVLVKAKDLLDRVPNITSIIMWNASTQSSQTCSRATAGSCPTTCVGGLCNFFLEDGMMIELYINDTIPLELNFTAGGSLAPPVELNFIKFDSGSSKKWIGLPANTTIVYARNLLFNLSFANTVSRYNESTQLSLGFLRVGAGIGKNFPVSPFAGFSITVTENGTWNQT
ncbi:MAG: LamG domain-containing protein [Nanoarchaeota archaeon]